MQECHSVSGGGGCCSGGSEGGGGVGIVFGYDNNLFS